MNTCFNCSNIFFTYIDSKIILNKIYMDLIRFINFYLGNVGKDVKFSGKSEHSG